jgi:hypothetical protein
LINTTTSIPITTRLEDRVYQEAEVKYHLLKKGLIEKLLEIKKLYMRDKTLFKDSNKNINDTNEQNEGDSTQPQIKDFKIEEEETKKEQINLKQEEINPKEEHSNNVGNEDSKKETNSAQFPMTDKDTIKKEDIQDCKIEEEEDIQGCKIEEEEEDIKESKSNQ